MTEAEFMLTGSKILESDNFWEELTNAIGVDYVLKGDDTRKWQSDWTNSYSWLPVAVVRPKTVQEVSAIMQIATRHKCAVVPVSGNTGLSGGTVSEGAVMLSLDRLNVIENIRVDARTMRVQAGVVLEAIHDAVEEHDLVFPLSFGARGSAQIGGCLATNAGGSNVLRYGNTRDLCLGLEVVLASGEVLDLMTSLHKDNSGLNLRNLFVGSEGILGIITGAILKLHPKPKAYATAMIAASKLEDSLVILNRLQEATGGMVEAFEYMPRMYIEQHLLHDPLAREPFDDAHDVNLMIELGAIAPADATPDDRGGIPIVESLQSLLMAMLEDGLLVDAVIAQNETQRGEMWRRRELAGELTVTVDDLVINDISLPLQTVAPFLIRAEKELLKIDHDARFFVVSHLGDGNVHFTIWPSEGAGVTHEDLRTILEDLVEEYEGSFSAEHGVGVSKLGSMSRRKSKVALNTMWAVKTALDPLNIMNPGKVLPLMPTQ
jgi:FAD/FMN-containing dehydrogenase